jgi:hypothetical protein
MFPIQGFKEETSNFEFFAHRHKWMRFFKGLVKGMSKLVAFHVSGGIP